MIRKFLLVDDDPDDTDLFLEALKAIDSTVELENSLDSRRIVSKLQKGEVNPEIIFLDINMPDMNGWDCLQVLKNDKRLKEIPVVMFSTSSVSRDGEKAIKNGALCFLEKPASFISLKEFLTQIVDASPNSLIPRLRDIEATKLHRLLVS